MLFVVLKPPKSRLCSSVHLRPATWLQGGNSLNESFEVARKKGYNKISFGLTKYSS